MLIFVVARSRLDRYEELRRQFGDWIDVRIILDRRRGERRTGSVSYAGLNRRQRERICQSCLTERAVFALRMSA
jgi:hypothetical protein